MKRIARVLMLLCIACASGAGVSFAQTARECIDADPDKSAGVYYAYPCDTTLRISVPDGYTPVYLSHYGRHGSRWQLTDNTYDTVLDILGRAFAADALTPKGIELLERVERARDDGYDRAGDLTAKGVAQHRGIAERMFRSFPELFAGESEVRARSTVVVRCVLSMLAFCERLKELNPALRITREADNKSTRCINFFNKLPGTEIADEYKDFISSGAWRREMALYADRTVPVSRLVGEFFAEGYRLDDGDARKLTDALFELSRLPQNVEPQHPFYDIFTKNEIYGMSLLDNYEYYVTRGPSPLNGGYPQHYAAVVLEDIIERADRALACGTPSVDLRFGHDGNIMAFIPLMRIDGYDAVMTDPAEIAERWRVWELTPMAANLQMVFFRNAGGDVLVKILLNEHEASVPVECAGEGCYSWEELRKFYVGILDGLKKPKLPSSE